MRALLLQVAHPAIARGVAEHSDFRGAPLARATATFDAVHGVVFGSREQALAHARRVYARHRQVRGAGYRATDPELLSWVFATLMDSAVQTHELFFGRLGAAERERLYQEGRLFAELFGLPRETLPADWRGFQDWFGARLDGPEIEVGRDAREIAAALFGGTRWLRAVAPLNRCLAAATLPPRLRAGFGLGYGRAARLGFTALVGTVRIALRVLPPRLRWLPAARRAYARCRRHGRPR